MITSLANAQNSIIQRLIKVSNEQADCLPKTIIFPNEKRKDNTMPYLQMFWLPSVLDQSFPCGAQFNNLITQFDIVTKRGQGTIDSTRYVDTIIKAFPAKGKFDGIQMLYSPTHVYLDDNPAQYKVAITQLFRYRV